MVARGLLCGFYVVCYGTRGGCYAVARVGLLRCLLCGC